MSGLFCFAGSRKPPRPFFRKNSLSSTRFGEVEPLTDMMKIPRTWHGSIMLVTKKATMRKIWILQIVLFLTGSLSAFATTWDEPWHDEIIKEAEYFVLAQIRSFDKDEGVQIKIIKTLGGEELSGHVEITDFYLLDLCSSSGGHGPEFLFEDIKKCYFFLKKNDKGKYCIATPTSGFARVNKKKVYATYRHSYHQALVSMDAYEKTMSAIFNYYHGYPFDSQVVTEYIDKYVSIAPAGFEESEIAIFFAQHAALETIFHLRLVEYYDKILPFLKDTSNFHNQVSASRALVAYNSENTKNELLTVIADSTRNDFVQVMCIWTLSAFNPVELKSQLTTIQETASTSMNGFEGNLMDPRVCTHVPDVKDALSTLIEKL